VLNDDVQLLRNYEEWLLEQGALLPKPLVWTPALATEVFHYLENHLRLHGGIMTNSPPFESHPYSNEFPLRGYEKYIIGTFPPSSYLCDRTGLNALFHPDGSYYCSSPEIPFYHGNMGAMWNYLLTPGELIALINTPRNQKVDYLVNLLNALQINYGDIISTTQRQIANGKYKADDECLVNIICNEGLIYHMIFNTSAKYLLFNTGSPFRKEGLKIHTNANDNGEPGNVMIANCGAFELLVRTLQILNYSVAIRMNLGPTPHFDWTIINEVNRIFIQNQLHNKVIFELKIIADAHSKELTVVTGPSPSPQARRGLPRNSNYLAWLTLNPGSDVEDFITTVYTYFRNNDWAGLYNLNV
jgi:hypothetical protein